MRRDGLWCECEGGEKVGRAYVHYRKRTAHDEPLDTDFLKRYVGVLFEKNERCYRRPECIRNNEQWPVGEVWCAEACEEGGDDGGEEEEGEGHGVMIFPCL